MKEKKEKKGKEGKKSSPLKIVGIIFLVFIMLFVGAGLFVRFTKPDTVDEDTQTETETENGEDSGDNVATDARDDLEPIESTEEDIVEEDLEPIEPVEEDLEPIEPTEEDSEEDLEPIDKDLEPIDKDLDPTEEDDYKEDYVYGTKDYESRILGIAFNYNTNMYLEEHTDTLFNILKESSEEGRNFNILEDSVVEKFKVLTIEYPGTEDLTLEVIVEGAVVSDGETEQIITEESEINYVVTYIEGSYPQGIGYGFIDYNKETYIHKDIDRYYTIADFNILENNKQKRVLTGFVTIGLNRLEVRLTETNKIQGVDIEKELFKILSTLEYTHKKGL